MEHLFKKETSLISCFKEGDVFLVDRGFRDVVPFLSKRGYDVKMPEFVEAGLNQLTTTQANRSRLVTKCRFVVEAVNGQLKQRFGLFNQEWSNRALSHCMSDFRIACAILNAFFKGIVSDISDGPSIAEWMLARVNQPNLLADYVSGQNLNRRSSLFKKMAADSIQNFPQLSLDDLRRIALGSYQLKQVHSYYAEHNRSSGRFEIQVFQHIGTLSIASHGISAGEPKLIRGRIQSRHSNSTKYYIYVLVDVAKAGAEAVIGHCCQCKSDLRTVGCCIHIMTVLWYLGFGKNQPEIKEPATLLNDVCMVLDSTDSEGE